MEEWEAAKKLLKIFDSDSWKNGLDYSRRRWSFVDWFYCKLTKKPRKSKILILGGGGVGKSTLGAELSGEHRKLLDEYGAYVESMDREVVRFEQRDWAEAEVMPGQARRLEPYLEKINASIVNGEYEGIILVSAYGFHSIPKVRKYNLHKTFVKGNSKSQWLEKYLKTQRDYEEAVWAQLEEAIVKNESPFWVLHFVSKKDLWNREVEAVEAHYENDAGFSDSFRKIFAKKVNQDFRFETVYGSLEIGNFELEGGDVLRKNSPGYTQKDQSDSMNLLFRTIIGLLEWKHGQKK